MVTAVYDRLGMVTLRKGDHDRATTLLEEALAQSRKRGDRLGTYTALYFLAQIALARGDHSAATRILKEGVALAAQVGPRGGLVYLLEGLAAAAKARGEALLQVLEAPVYKHYRPKRSLRPLERTMAAVRSSLGEEAFEEARSEGQAMSFEQAVAYALETDKALPPTPP